MPDKAPAKKEGKQAVSESNFFKSDSEKNNPGSENLQTDPGGAIDYRLLFSNTIEMVLILAPVLDENGKLQDAQILDVNPAFSNLTGITNEQACGKMISQVLPPIPENSQVFGRLQADIEAAATGSSPRKGEVFWPPAERYFLYQIFALNQKQVAAVGIDVTAQKETLQALQENQARLTLSEEQVEETAARLGITHKLIESREAERLAIANQLHEGLLQGLIGIRYAIEEGLSIDQKDLRLARMAGVQATLQREIQNLRDYCNELRPPTLAPFGLEKTIRAHVENYQKKNPKTTVSLDLAADRQLLPESTRLVLFRVFQQILKSIALRSQAQQVWVRFFFDETQATLEMQDDGEGSNLPARWFDLAEQDQMELASAFERVEGIGGMMQVQSTPGKGTLVRVTVPIKIAA